MTIHPCSSRTRKPAALLGLARGAVALGVIGCLRADMLAAQSDSARHRPRAGTLDGLVSDTSLAPLADATISLLGSDIRVVTGANGRFRIVAIPPGQYTLLARRIGFEAATARVQVAAAETLRVSFSLERVATSLSPVLVKAAGMSQKMAEFYARRERGEGQFMTQAEIEARNSVETTDLLRTFRSIAVTPTYAWSTRGGLIHGCMFRVVVDGATAFTRMDQLPPIKDIAGIEVYSGPASMPLPYKAADGTCGLIMIWTKEGS